jgi:hypothetical protein
MASPVTVWAGFGPGENVPNPRWNELPVGGRPERIPAPLPKLDDQPGVAGNAGMQRPVDLTYLKTEALECESNPSTVVSSKNMLSEEYSPEGGAIPPSWNSGATDERASYISPAREDVLSRTVISRGPASAKVDGIIPLRESFFANPAVGRVEDLFTAQNRRQPVDHVASVSGRTNESGQSSFGQVLYKGVESRWFPLNSSTSVIQNSQPYQISFAKPASELADRAPGMLVNDTQVDIKQEDEAISSPVQPYPVQVKSSPKDEKFHMEEEDEFDMANIIKYLHYNHKKFRKRTSVDAGARVSSSSHEMLPVTDERTGRSSVIMVSRRGASQAIERATRAVISQLIEEREMESREDVKSEKEGSEGEVEQAVEDVSVEELQTLLQVRIVLFLGRIPG